MKEYNPNQKLGLEKSFFGNLQERATEIYDKVKSYTIPVVGSVAIGLGGCSNPTIKPVDKPKTPDKVTTTVRLPSGVEIELSRYIKFKFDDGSNGKYLGSGNFEFTTEYKGKIAKVTSLNGNLYCENCSHKDYRKADEFRNARLMSDEGGLQKLINQPGSSPAPKKGLPKLE